MMLGEPSDENPQARYELFSVPATLPAPPVESRHWYVDAADIPGYCAACGTPEHNRRRHTPRRSAGGDAA